MRWECEACGEPLEIQKAGRPSKFCSNACRQWAYRQRRARRIPPEMVAACRWAKSDGKRPVTITGAPASSTDPAGWCGYEDVKTGPHGFMLGGGFACIDLDQCLNRRGVIARWALAIIKAVPGAFVEKSISGKGLHVFGLAPEGPGRRIGPVEWYSSSRFIRMTEQVYRPGDLVALAPAWKMIERLHQKDQLPLKNRA